MRSTVFSITRREEGVFCILGFRPLDFLLRSVVRTTRNHFNLSLNFTFDYKLVVGYVCEKSYLKLPVIMYSDEF